MNCEPEFRVVYPMQSSSDMDGIKELLKNCDLSIEPNIGVFVAATLKDQIVACAGLEKNVLKCVAVSSELRGEAFCLPLISEIIKLAAEKNVFHLFLYCKPDNIRYFLSCGFYRLVEVPNLVVLMENSPIAIARYCDGLRHQRRPGKTVGAIVMNANPFTLGHLYLVEKAAADCDWLHLFVVGEDASLIPYAGRFALVNDGVGHLKNLTVHPGSEYVISHATFPGYFLKDSGVVDGCWTAMDLLLFREYIAPALGITHRFVGTEPFCLVTNRYNKDMKHWLQDAPSQSRPVSVVEVPRISSHGVAISATEVRRLLFRKDFAGIKELVPATTLKLLWASYHQATRSNS